jgi:colanic acid/amylovoran biosynthesis glycosyltransferase
MAIGLPEDRIRVWRIPIELDTYQYQPRVPSTQVRFIIAARFVEKKGYPYVLEAFDKMVKEGKNVKLTMIGYGDERYKVEEDIKQRQLEAHTRLLDTKVQGNFPAFYYKELLQHDIFVLPSTTAKKGDDEGGPALTLVAAQAAGLPVICTPFPGAEMSVVENETGIFCAFNDANSLYKKMVYLYDHPEQWNRLGQSASSFVHKAFSMKPQMEEVLAIYREAVKK